MILLLGVVAVWLYLVVGFGVLALIAGDIEPFDEQPDFGALTGLVVIFFWPIVAGRTIVRRWRINRVKRVLAGIPDHARCVAHAYERLGRVDGDRILCEMSREKIEP